MRENAILVAVGQTGAGKTTEIRQYVDRARRCIIADPEGKWISHRPAGPEVLVTSGPQLLAHLEAIDAGDPAVPFRIIYRDDAERMKVAAPAAAFAIRNLTLAFDEIVWICSGRSCPTWLTRVIQVGRERRINLVLTTRVPAEIPSLLLQQASVRLFFHMDPGPGLRRVAEDYGIPKDDILALPDHVFRMFGSADTLRYFGREGLDLPRVRTLSSRSKQPRQR